MDIKAKLTSIKNSTIDSILKRIDLPKKLSEGYVVLSQLSPEERTKAFTRFAEGNEGLLSLLTTAYDYGIEFMFSCAGHSNNDFGYVVFLVTDDNLEQLQQLGKLLSHGGVSTNFENHYEFGRRVSFHRISCKR